MAHLFKPTYTRLIPENSTPCVHQGKKAVSWKGRGGRRMVAIICADNPNRCSVEGEIWWVKYTDENDEVQKIKGYKDKRSTEKMMIDLVTDVDRVKAGFLPESRPNRKQTTFDDDLKKYEEHLRSLDRDDEYVKLKAKRIARIAEGCEVSRSSEFRPDAVLSKLKEWRLLPRKDRGISAMTSNHYLTAIRGFTRYLVIHAKRLSSDPLVSLTRQPTQAQTFYRRALSVDHFVHFIDSVRNSTKTYQSLDGIERSNIYLLAAKTGLRAKEIASMKIGDFSLHDSQPTARLEAPKTKNRKNAVIPFPRKYVDLFKTMFVGRDPAEFAFPKLRTTKRGKETKWAWRRFASRMMRFDLKLAGIPFKDGSGRVYDFHALRGQFITDLDRAGVSLSRAQKLARHSTPLLTAKYYTKTEIEELGDSVDLI